MKKILIQKPKQQFKYQTMSELSELCGVKEAQFLKAVKYAEIMYQPTKLLKKSGLEFRTIQAPTQDLKKIQRSILDGILVTVPLFPFAYGCGPAKTIVDNAWLHRLNPFLLNVDIIKFFPTVHFKKVHQLYIELGFSEEQASALTRLTTLNKALPEGAPTSPYLSSLILNSLDFRLKNLCKVNRLTYSRYFDDITISGGERALQVFNKVAEITASEGFKIHMSGDKVQRFTSSEEKTVTGIRIDLNGNLSVPQILQETEEYLEELTKHGLSALRSDMQVKEKESLQGKIEFIKQVQPYAGQQLKMQFDQIPW